jgi:hypothetical protein
MLKSHFSFNVFFNDFIKYIKLHKHQKSLASATLKQYYSAFNIKQKQTKMTFEKQTKMTTQKRIKMTTQKRIKMTTQKRIKMAVQKQIKR